jgi:NADH dehydrogenase
LFQPLLYQVATAALSPADIAAPIRSIFAGADNVRVLLDELVAIDPNHKSVSLGSGATLSYDALVLATGARHSYFGKDEWAANATGLKTIEDALAIRRNVLLAFERAETEQDPERRQALLTFVVVGGGPTGVEMAGAIAELAHRSVSRDFRTITPHCSRILLVEAGSRVLPSFAPRLSAAAASALKKLGVELRFGDPVADVGAGYVQVGNQLVFADTVIWAAGVEASPAADWLQAARDRNGRIIVGADLRVPRRGEVFAIGDTANATSHGVGTYPAVAPVAKQQGEYVADVILGRRSGPFAYRDYGNLATIGRNYAVIQWRKVQLSGFVAWLIWSSAHIWFLIGFRRRLTVGIGWLWSYLTYQRAARLITGEIPLLPQRQQTQTLERKSA